MTTELATADLDQRQQRIESDLTTLKTRENGLLAQIASDYTNATLQADLAAVRAQIEAAQTALEALGPLRTEVEKRVLLSRLTGVEREYAAFFSQAETAGQRREELRTELAQAEIRAVALWDSVHDRSLTKKALVKQLTGLGATPDEIAAALAPAPEKKPGLLQRRRR